ncbi:hypothetical protein QQE94_00210 [Fervidobacterium pennivorans subsp. shakshaketiis]|jgi:hypothetical protein|uniref:Uncharacterized protein n=1 Tax=Fervidobacterium pennivorans (strain DSM 9078 / Ven5) TaxID=771875 RepID=H9U9L5_FERPD|nr:hypothetical protein [Fervidobacterium pennivorans]AFG34208.1 hypothetical protein Ferpe_0046 [Fervidobacterium pennivorans DSM 9078]QIV77585.1 hypothetical protein HER11_00220 [Fervidobacterium pennivorans subsp. keratinolyticus]
MEKEEIEKKLIESIEKLEEHLKRYEEDVENINLRLQRLQEELDDAWNNLRIIVIVTTVVFVVMAVTWFFPFQAATYRYLSIDDIQRKIVALSVEALFFGLLFIVMLWSILSRRFRG